MIYNETLISKTEFSKHLLHLISMYYLYASSDKKMEILQKNIDPYYMYCKKFKSEILEKGIENLILNTSKTFPKVGELYQSCLKINEENNIKTADIKQANRINMHPLPSLKDLVCQADRTFYKVGIELSEMEKYLCQAKDIKYLENQLKGKNDYMHRKDIQVWQNTADYAKQCTGVVLCDWCFQLLRAKKNPESGEAVWCERMIQYHPMRRKLQHHTEKIEMHPFVNKPISEKVASNDSHPIFKISYYT